MLGFEYASCTWSPHQFLKYSKLKLYKGNSPSDFLGIRVTMLLGEAVAS